MNISRYTLINHEGNELGKDECEMFLSFMHDFLCCKDMIIVYRGKMTTTYMQNIGHIVQ